MKRIIEKKVGKKSVFTLEIVIDGTIIDSRIINVQVDTVKVKNKVYSLLYNSTYELVEDAYNYLNHNPKRLSQNSIKASVYALRYLYIYSEIINKPVKNFDRNDFLRLNYFLSGVSADGSEFEYNLLTKRGTASINSFFSVYREFYRFLGYTESPVLKERSFSKYTPSRNEPKASVVQEVPKFISAEEFADIIKYIRENVKNKERRLRDECIVRIMYEGGCRLGEVLGSTLEDYVVVPVGDDDEEICFMYIRNRITDRDDQNAKTCMNVFDRKTYHSDSYTTNWIGYQLTFLNMDTYDLICEYIDLAHDRAYKKFRANYDKTKADAVAGYKEKNENNYYLFLNNRGEPLTDEGWNKKLRKIFDEVGIHVDSGTKKENLSHRFRHGFIMHLIYDLKLPREQVMIRSRHRNYSSLDAYYNPTIEQIIKMKTDIEDQILRPEVDKDE